MNRGLIEGAERGRRIDTLTELPRFMNRGLIEGASSLAAPGTARYFPDS